MVLSQSLVKGILGICNTPILKEGCFWVLSQSFNDHPFMIRLTDFKKGFNMNSDKFKGCHFPKAIVLQSVYWYLRYSLSYRYIKELMNERGVDVDHSSVQRWVVKYTGIVEESFRKKKKSVGKSWRMDETYIKIKGKWHYLYRAVDKGVHPKPGIFG